MKKLGYGTHLITEILINLTTHRSLENISGRNELPKILDPIPISVPNKLGLSLSVIHSNPHTGTWYKKRDLQ